MRFKFASYDADGNWLPVKDRVRATLKNCHPHWSALSLSWIGSRPNSAIVGTCSGQQIERIAALAVLIGSALIALFAYLKYPSVQKW